MKTSMLFDSRHTSKVGFMSLFAYGQFLAEESGAIFKPAIIGDISELTTSLELLGLDKVRPLSYQESSRLAVVPLVTELMARGMLEIQERDMLNCQCGKVKIPAEAILRKTSTTLLKDGITTCCKSALFMTSTMVIQTRPILFSDQITESYPAWGQKEIRDMRANFAGKSLVISRTNETHIFISTDEGDFFLDNDMFVYLSPLLTAEHPTDIIAGTSLVKQSTLYTYFASVLRPDSGIPKFHYLPRVNYKGKRSLSDLCAVFDHERIRAKLLSCAKSGRQVIDFDDSGIR